MNLLYEENYKVVDTWRTYLIRRLAQCNISKEKYLNLINNIRNYV